MVVGSGLADSDPEAAFRQEICRFVDDRLSPAAKLAFIRSLLHRDMAEVRMFLERIEGLFATLSEADRQSPAYALALGDIARDDAARERYLKFAEDADLPRIRARMIQLAVTLGWLAPADQPPSSCAWSGT